MRCTIRRASWLVGIGVALGAWVFAAQHADAQGTALSAQIRAQAAYVWAQGQFLESAAIAREINARAVEQEIKNSVEAVRAYWERKSIWEEEYKKRNPSHMEREKHFQEVLQRRIKEQYQDVLKGDVTDQLNWLLRELSGPALAAQYLSRDQGGGDAQLNMKLTPRDLDQIWLTDGGRGNKLVFRLGDPKILETRWPLALRSPEFDAARASFAAARDALLKEAKGSKDVVSYETGKQLIQAVDELFVALENTYPQERRKTPAEFIDYNDCKHYLQALLAGALRALKTNDRSIFDGNMRFQGSTLLDLVQYMYQNGLLFSRPPDGGEGVYSKLFLGLRNMYVILSPDKKADGGEKPAGGANKPAGVNPL